MKPYPKYRSVDIEWIGEMPEHWERNRLKFVARINPSGKNSKELEGSSLVPFLPMENLTENGQFDFGVMKPLDELQSGFTYFQEGDVIVAKITPCFENGKAGLLSGVAGGFGFGSTEFHVLRAIPSCLDKRFLYLIIRSHSFRSMGEALMTGSAGQKRVPTWFVSEYKLAIPPLPEQQAIATYLDDKTRKLDTLIEKKQRLIELLKEQRTAIINQAVTKGINPNVRMKDSGIEWIGEIPEHWEVVGMTKYLESIVDYRGRTPEKVEEGVFLVTARNIKEGKIDYSLSAEFISVKEYQAVMGRGLPKIGDVLFTTEAPLGEVANVDDERVALAQRVIKFRGKQDCLDNYFLKYWIMSFTFQSDLQSYATGSTALGIKASKLNLLKLVLPMLSEQREIVRHLDIVTANFGRVADRTQREISLLQEYRAALISEVVTGKIDVRDYVSGKSN